MNALKINGKEINSSFNLDPLRNKTKNIHATRLFAENPIDSLFSTLSKDKYR